MSREVRRVPATWQHPKGANGEYRPLRDGLSEAQREWDEAEQKWMNGFVRHYDGNWHKKSEAYFGDTYAEYAGERPHPYEYMPDWPAEARTHYMMYETTSEGTPISPAFETPEGLARWLYRTGARSFGAMTATYDQWLRVAQGGYAPSLIVDASGIRSGVEGAQ